MGDAHDLGGASGFGPVVVPGGAEVFHELWEGRAFAIQILVGLEGLGAGLGGRATRELMAPDDYLAASYYERWLWSAERRLERKGTIAPGEVEGMMARLRAGEASPTRTDPGQATRAVEALKAGFTGRLPEPASTRFALGDRVTVTRTRPAGHTRCPKYIRGMTGVVERVQCEDALPDVAGDGQVEPVYSVAFRSSDLSQDRVEPEFTVLVDLWESYLEPMTS